MASSTVQQCADLLAVIAVALAICGAILWTPFRNSVLVTVFALSLVLFLPGYALLAALFPKNGENPAERNGGRLDSGIEYYRNHGIDVTERVVLSVVVSVVTTPLLGLLIDASPYGLRRTPVAITLTATTVVVAIVGIGRRISVPPEERFSPWPLVAQFHRQTSTASSGTIAFNALIVVCLLIAASGGMYAADRADESEALTELYLLSESGDGDLVNEMPEQFVHGETDSVSVGVGNMEHRSVTYTVVIRLERLDSQTDRVVESEQLDRYDITLQHGDDSVDERQIRPSIEGERLRLAVLLYVDDPPAEPTTENAYRDAYAWVDVVRR